MELALATREVDARSALTVAARRLLLLIALGYAIAYIVPACFSLASLQVNEQRRSSSFVPVSGSMLQAQLVCGSASPRLWQRGSLDLADQIRLPSAHLQPAVMQSSLLCGQP